MADAANELPSISRKYSLSLPSTSYYLDYTSIRTPGLFPQGATRLSSKISATLLRIAFSK